MKNKCGDCANYVQHFAIQEGKVKKIWCGHCTKSNKKKLDQDSKACDDFVPGQSVDNKLVNKEYLTETLLNKVLSLELWQKE